MEGMSCRPAGQNDLVIVLLPFADLFDQRGDKALHFAGQFQLLLEQEMVAGLDGESLRVLRLQRGKIVQTYLAEKIQRLLQFVFRQKKRLGGQGRVIDAACLLIISHDSFPDQLDGLGRFLGGVRKGNGIFRQDI